MIQPGITIEQPTLRMLRSLYVHHIINTIINTTVALQSRRGPNPTPRCHSTTSQSNRGMPMGLETNL